MDGIPTPGHLSRLPYHWGSGSHSQAGIGGIPGREARIVMRMQCPVAAN